MSKKKEVQIFSLLMNNTYQDILNQHTVGPDKLVLSRNDLKVKEIAPDYMSFWNQNNIDFNKYKMSHKSISLCRPTSGHVEQLKFSVTSKKLFVHSEWFWDQITLGELNELAKINELSFVRFPSDITYKEKLIYFKQLDYCFIPLHFGLYIKNPIAFDSVP